MLDSGYGRDMVLADAEIIASELVTNAVQAGCSDIALTLSIHRGRLRLAVRDDAPGRPTLLAAAPEDQHGRGLAIVDSLTKEWAVDYVSGGKEVWAELSVPDALTTKVQCA
jgi:anti-sigma regulatory factor (Ser/Thr protein kinase)